jgi:predicted TIM-barrel fold metal-dependent hydrolase
MSYRVFANHAHLLPKVLHPDAGAERVLRLMDACGIDQAVGFAPLPHQCDQCDIKDQNKWLADELRSAGRSRLVGFGTIDPRKSNLREQVQHVKDLGLLGLKLHPNAQSFAIIDPRLDELYETAQDLKLFCTFHSGVHQSRLKDTRVIDFDELAWKFPRLRFSMEHVGGYHFFNEALAVIFNHVPPPWEPDQPCNVFAGLASVFCPHHNRFWYLSDDRIRELAAQVGVRQLIFGLDFPYNKEENTRTGLETIRRLFNAEEQEMILGGNLRRELGLAAVDA